MTQLLSKYLKPSMTRAQARDAAHGRSMRVLGDGQSTVAFSFRIIPEVSFSPLDDPYTVIQKAQVPEEQRVLRISTNETGMRTTIAIAMLYPDDPFAPKVYETMELVDGFACVNGAASSLHL